MTIKLWQDRNANLLKSAGVTTAQLDALILLEDATKKDRAYLLAHPEQEIDSQQAKLLKMQIGRRINHEPLAYIRGKSEFYGREFLVDENVLVPRPESEALVALATEQVKGCRLEVRDTTTIVDVGTGSGALAINVKLELPAASVVAIDIDPKCLAIANKNAKKHKADIEFIEGDLLAPLFNLQPITSNLVILANLPYVPSDYEINKAATHEPMLALYGGVDGLDLYRRLFEQLKRFTVNGLRFTVLTESLVFQHSELAKIARASGFKQTNEVDLIQVFQSQS